ncbi:MAG: hypothetical protein II956_01740 [Bacteroidales bacterium]|nr:hypothetical protein [Bacteroidales bacterium]
MSKSRKKFPAGTFCYIFWAFTLKRIGMCVQCGSKRQFRGGYMREYVRLDLLENSTAFLFKRNNRQGRPACLPVKMKLP